MPGGDRGDGSKREIGKDFVVGVSEGEGISDVKKPTEEISLKEDDYASGSDDEYENRPTEQKQSLKGGPGATRPSLSVGLRTEVIHSTHKTGSNNVFSTKVAGQAVRNVTQKPPNRPIQKQIADLSASPKPTDDYYWGPEGNESPQSLKAEKNPVKQLAVDSQPNLENLSPEIQLQALVDRYVINSKNPEIKAELQGTSAAGSYKLVLSFKNDKGVLVADSERIIEGKIKGILRQLEARLKEKGYQKKLNKK